MLRMTNVDLANKNVLIRQDLNVPLQNGVMTNTARIDAALPTLQLALDKQAKLIVTSHLGRPTEGEYDEQFSLAPIAHYIEQQLNVPVHLVKDYLEQPISTSTEHIVLLENVRFNPGEKKNDPSLAKRLAQLCDIYVGDAFGTAHRAQASTYGVAEYANIACAGPLLAAEIDALSQGLSNPARPLVAIVGGAKVSTKLTVLDELMDKVDQLIVGGGIANTFLAAQDYFIGASLCEHDLIDNAKRLLEKAQAANKQILLPKDVVVGTELNETATATIKALDTLTDNDKIFDIGPATQQYYHEVLQQAGTIVWNGPVGVFEFAPFAKGTEALAKAIAKSPAFSLAGGGDTLAAIDQFNIREDISYISTGGGAFLEFLEGKKLPAIEILEKRSND